ncbi:MAG: KdsC family phosphatase [Cyclobacteriaceae bacterium]|jgi:3-deoxy-D-manno-octulosonate 8-phosphate phosphatase (KDO 8-P phosphatase)
MAKKHTSAAVPKALLKKASGIKALIFDVDGVLTDGRIIYTSSGDELKEFHVRDGMIVAPLKKIGLVLGVISGRESQAVARRCSELKLDFCHQGIDDKGWAISQIIKHHKLRTEQVAYIGDDINDLPAFNQAGFRVCPADAPNYLRENMDLVTSAKGGKGVLREVGDLILMAKGALDELIQFKPNKK